MRWRSLVAILVIRTFLAADPMLAQKFPPGFFSTERVKQGEELSLKFCGSCHLWPSPEILDRDTWMNGALPWMMTLLGLTLEALPSGVEGELIRKSGSVLSEPALKQEEFGKIVAYYLHSSPIVMSKPDRPPAPIELKLFSPRPLAFRSPNPMALLVNIDELSRTILFGDGAAGRLERLRPGGEATNVVPLRGAPVAVKEFAHGLYVTCAGSFSPSEQPKGSVVYVPRIGKEFGRPRPVLSGLLRPVHTDFADLNHDGRQDLVVCQFGWYSGRLSWFEQIADDRYVEHELIPKPGALRTVIRDLNGDGHPDIAVLLAQASEKLAFLYNDGTGQFTEKLILQKHPAFGHSYFEFADFNGDGRPDIVTANGDNGDYPSPSKPYHGIRIYLNEGHDRFSEAYFRPLPGATKAMARDFDGDGDLDLACIAYYADFHSTRPENFVYLENRGNLKFEVSTFATSTSGRWLTLDVGDVDGDGDPDILLGAVRKGPGRDAYIPPDLARQWQESGLALLLLENLLSKRKETPNATNNLTK